MPRIRSLVPSLTLVAVLLSLAVLPARAAERTFVLAPADLVPAVDAYNADLLAHSASLGKAVAIRRGVVNLAREACPSLTADPQRRMTRVRVLDGPARAALLAGTSRRPNLLLGDALAFLGAAVWGAPASGRTRQPSWISEPVIPGVAAFATVGFPTGDDTGALTFEQGADPTASYRVDVNIGNGPAHEAVDLVVGITSELPPTRPGKMPKRIECFALVPTFAADVQGVSELVAAATLTDTTRNRLHGLLTDAADWLENGQNDRAVRKLKSFAVEVAGRSAVEIGPADAEALLNRALRVIEAIEL
jgi:hypothetical protein